MNGFEVFDSRFESILLPGARLERLAGGCTWSEGPVYLRDQDCVFWSDIPGNRVMRWSQADGVGEYLKPADFHNGHTLDHEGRVLACSHGQRAVVRLEHNGVWQTLVDRHQGKRLNSPNDLVVKRDGTIWFTDPPYGLIQPNEGHGGVQEQTGCFVYRFDPVSLELTAVITDMVKPNGLAFSLGERMLYVSDTSKSHDAELHHHVRVYDVIDGRTCVNGRVFAVIDPGLPDGFRLDAQGWLFISSGDSVQVYAPDATLLGKILLPEPVANLVFGGPEKNKLFITASSGLYSIDLRTHGGV